MISLRTDRTLIRAGARSTRHLLVEIDVPHVDVARERRPLNVALVLDRSGSMGGDRKFGLARQAVERCLAMLRPSDRFSLVVYDHEVDVLVPATPASDESRQLAMSRLAGIAPRGTTDLGAGWLRGCEQVARYLDEQAIGRALLLTDGLANQGITDHGELTRHAAELRERGISTSTFGLGADFDERLLRDMAHEGGGNFYFIETAAQIPDLLSSELGEALEVVIPRAALEIQLPPGADAEPLNRFRFTQAAGDRELRVEVGDLVSGQQLRVTVMVKFARGEEGRDAEVGVALAGHAMLRPAAAATIAWRYASHVDNDRQPRDVVVDREVATLRAARARAEATEANRRGDLADARWRLEQAAAQIGHFAGDDGVMRSIVRGLEDDLPEYGDAMMEPMALKAATFAAEMVWKDRSVTGRARRRGRDS